MTWATPSGALAMIWVEVAQRYSVVPFTQAMSRPAGEPAATNCSGVSRSHCRALSPPGQ
jgi:hypothetical protein